MPDPSVIPSSIADVVEKVGLTIATIIGLVYVLKWLSQMHLTALNDRITALEGVAKEKDAIIAKANDRITEMQETLLSKTEIHAHDMKSVAMLMIANDKENREFMREHQEVVRNLLDKFNVPRPLVPHDLPEVPGTDRQVKS